MIKLSPMLKESYAEYRTHLDTLFAGQTKQAYDTHALPISDGLALAFSRKVLSDLMPEGYGSAYSYFLDIVNDETVIGHIWFTVQKDMESDIAFLRYIDLLPQHQSQGHGRETLQLFIEKVKTDFGVKNIQLNVYGFNHAALHLYETLGFETMKATMSLTLD